MPYTRRPYVQPAYEPGNLRLGDLMRSRGRSLADAELRSGDIAAQMWANLGNTIAGTVGGIMREREDAPVRQMERENVTLKNQALKQEAQQGATARQIQGQALRQSEDGTWTYDRDYLAQEFQRAGIADRLPGVLKGLDEFDASARTVMEAKRNGLAGLAFSVMQLGNTPEAFNQAAELAIKNGYITQKELGPLRQRIGNDPAKIGEAMTLLAGQSPKFAEQLKSNQPEAFTLSPGQQRFGPDGKPIASVAPNAPQQSGFNLSPGQTRFGPDGKPIASLPPAAPARDNEPLVPVIGPDNQPVLVPRSQAVGKRPASNREQGRPVTSGDANRLAELDTSLNDLATLSATLKETKDATGAMAAAGAKVWSPITELTGWGTDAKKRQGVIDRVKQVIGKALEGGVLRKEDEAKYAKILPTIMDTPEVAASKLEGLQKALVQRRQTTLEALSDAGYDTSKFGDTMNGATVKPLGDDDPLGLFK